MFRKKSKGQGMVEYLLIIALIAIIVIAGIRLLGNTVDTKFHEQAATIAGN